MNWQEIKEIFAGMPAYIAEGFRNTVAYWSGAHPVLRGLEFVYLIILMAVFYFAVTYTSTILEGSVEPIKNSFDWWWIMLTPFTQVGTIFLVWGIYRKFARFIIKVFNIPLPDES